MTSTDIGRALGDARREGLVKGSAPGVAYQPASSMSGKRAEAAARPP
jgi:hypothetical protein